MAIGVIMALSQQHLADEQRTILMSRAKVSGSITGPKINECMCLHEANILTDPTPHSIWILTACRPLAPFLLLTQPL